MELTSKVECGVCGALTADVIVISNTAPERQAKRYFSCRLCTKDFKRWEKSLHDNGIETNYEQKIYDYESDNPKGIVGFWKKYFSKRTS